MKEVFKNGWSLFLRMIIVVLMSSIVTISFSILSTAIFTKEIGYKAFVYNEKGERMEDMDYDYRYDSGKDTKLEEYQSKKYTVKQSKYRSELEGKGYIINQVSSQLISVLFMFIFIYNKLFTLGNRDLNLVKTGHKTEDKLKGFKIGLVSSIPSFVLFAAILICALGVNREMTIGLFSLPNFHIFQIIRAITGPKFDVGQLNALQFILLFLSIFIVPLISQLSYWLGYKDISIMEKIIYKKRKKR